MNDVTDKRKDPSQKPQPATAPVQGIPPQADGMAEWLDKLKDCCTKEIAGVISTGTLLHAAKAALKGRWAEFKRSDASSFTPRKVEMLMRIARNKALADAQHYAHLPAAWTVLHALAAIPETRLVELIHSHHITPRLTLKAAHALDLNHKQKPVKPLSAAGLERIRERIEESATFWTAEPGEGVNEVIGRLEEIQEQINSVTTELTTAPAP